MAGRWSASPELELTFLLAGTARRRAAARHRTLDLLGTVDFGVLRRELADRRLLALIGSRLGELAPDRLPESFAESVATAIASSRARAAGSEAVTLHLVETLRESGIAALPLKGSFLARSAHGDPGLRIAGDIDLLVAADDLDQAAALLCRVGYEAPAKPRAALPDLHHALAHPSLPPVELHWRVHWYEGAFSGDMLARSTLGPDGILAPARSDELTALLLYFARDAFHGLRLAADIAGWSDRHLADLAPGALDQAESAYPGLARALGAAAQVAERFTGVPGAALLSSLDLADRRAVMAGRLADWSGVGDPDQMRANVSLVDGLLAPRGGEWAFVRRQVLPPAREVAMFYSLPLTATYRVMAGRVTHAAKLLARYAIALWRLRRAYEWVSVPVAAPRPR